MGDRRLQISNPNIENYIVSLLEKIESLRNESLARSPKVWKIPIQTEMRTLEFWRSVMCECLASFCYVFIVCGAVAGAGAGASVNSVLFATALATGLASTTLTQCFGQISGAHINPAVTIAVAITRNVSLIRAMMFIIAQCGGGIAGAAFLYGMNIPGAQSNLAVGIIGSTVVWERFGVELILSFVIVLTYLVTMNNYSRWLGASALTIGAAYASCTLVSMPYLNPARSLGPSFVLSRWENHWVYWFGPLAGGILAAFTYEFVLNPRRQKAGKDTPDAESLSVPSDEDTYDNVDRPPPQGSSKCNSATYKYRPPAHVVVSSGSGYVPNLATASLYSAPQCKLDKLDPVESLYGGTKSLYCKSPPLTRANLNRSQSVYTKANNSSGRDTLPRAGPLVPTQSLYPMATNQQNHLQNQNVQNQIQQRSESGFGTRGISATTNVARADVYGTVGSNTTHSSRNNGTDADNVKYEETKKVRSNRPESMYGLTTNQNYSRPAQYEDHNYSMYNPSKRNNNNGTVIYHNTTGNLTVKTPNNVYAPLNSEANSTLLQPVTSTASSYPLGLPKHPNTAQF